ncbi:MAG: TonB-dependent receptor domain-containing protein, partial [Thermoflexibacteraceae bacterium]
AFLAHDWKAKKWSLQSSLQVNQNFIFPKSAYNNTFSSYERIYKYGYERHLFLRELLNYKIASNQQFTGGATFQLSNALARTANLPSVYNTSLSPSEQETMYHTGTDTVDYTGRFLGVPIEYYEENRVQAGAFAQYQITIREKLDLIAGGRFDYLALIHPEENESHSYPSFNARAGLVYKPNKNIRFKLFYGSAFLTPSPNKTLTYFGSFRLVKDSLGRITNVSPNLWKLPLTEESSIFGEEPVPEKLQSIESAFIYTKNDLLFGLSGYYNMMTNLLQNELFYNLPFFDSLPPVPVAQITTSEGEGIAYGATARVEYIWRINEQTNIRTNASYSYLGGQLTDDDGRSFTLPFSAEHTVKAGLGFQYKKFNIYVKGLYRTTSFNEGSVSSTGQYVQNGNPSFLILSAFANYQVAALDKERFLIDIFVRARNLTNARYYNTSLLNAAAFSAVPQEPFGIFGGVQLRFNR